MKEKVYLSLENGKVLQGYRFGADADVVGELVFTTGMVGNDKTMTDPAYYGQIVVQTFPLIGNYGMNDDDYETEIPSIGALVVHEYNDEPSNYRSKETLGSVMKRFGITGIYGVDTRMIGRSIMKNTMSWR
jgi:carbamoyl-phosphate synthase small subunit